MTISEKDYTMTALTLFHNLTLKQPAIQYTIYHINDRLVISCTPWSSWYCLYAMHLLHNRTLLTNKCCNMAFDSRQWCIKCRCFVRELVRVFHKQLLLCYGHLSTNQMLLKCTLIFKSYNAIKILPIFPQSSLAINQNKWCLSEPPLSINELGCKNRKVTEQITLLYPCFSHERQRARSAVHFTKP